MLCEKYNRIFEGCPHWSWVYCYHCYSWSLWLLSGPCNFLMSMEGISSRDQSNIPNAWISTDTTTALWDSHILRWKFQLPFVSNILRSFCLCSHYLSKIHFLNAKVFVAFSMQSKKDRETDKAQVLGLGHEFFTFNNQRETLLFSQILFLCQLNMLSLIPADIFGIVNICSIDFSDNLHWYP